MPALEPLGGSASGEPMIISPIPSLLTSPAALTEVPLSSPKAAPRMRNPALPETKERLRSTSGAARTAVSALRRVSKKTLHFTDLIKCKLLWFRSVSPFLPSQTKQQGVLRIALAAFPSLQTVVKCTRTNMMTIELAIIKRQKHLDHSDNSFNLPQLDNFFEKLQRIAQFLMNRLDIADLSLLLVSRVHKPGKDWGCGASC